MTTFIKTNTRNQMDKLKQRVAHKTLEDKF